MEGCAGCTGEGGLECMGLGKLGGGEALKFMGKGAQKVSSMLDEGLIKLFMMVPFVKILVGLLITVITVILILKAFNIRSILKGRAIRTELKYIDEVKHRDEYIIRTNNNIRRITRFIENTPFSLNKAYRDYWNYNINRAGIRIPGGSRYMKAEEFNALIQMVALFSMGIAILIIAFINSMLGWVLLIFVIVITNYCPMMIVRQMVKEKDMEIRSNFADFYLMIHYVLIASSGTPLISVLKSYEKTTTSKEMHRLVDVCTHYIDTYGEYEATRYIAKDFRELPEIGKLMRLIRQVNEGGNIKAELLGFRTELINEKKYNMGKKMEKLVGRAKLSFNILMIVLVQAILSAMSIYLSDLGLIKGLIG